MQKLDFNFWMKSHYDPKIKYAESGANLMIKLNKLLKFNKI